MRIIGGNLKGRVLRLPKRMDVRPTTDRGKEALFNVLRHRLDWSSLRCLDLFAGTGSVGLEMISRGAAHVDFVDHNPLAIRHITDTLKEWKLTEGHASQSDAFRWLRQSGPGWDVVFMDPPYALDDALKLPSMVFEFGHLLPEGWMVLEHGAELAKPMLELPGFVEQRPYGSVHFSFFQNPSDLSD